MVSYSTDGGISWTRCNLSGVNSGFCYCLAVSPPSDIVYAGGEVLGAGAVYISTDGGFSWSQTRSAPADTVFALAVDPLEPDRVYAGTRNGVYLSTDRGVSWEQLFSGSAVRSVRIHPQAPDTVFAAGDSGCWISRNRGLDWEPMNHGLGSPRLTAMEFVRAPGLMLLAGTQNRSCYRMDLSTGVKEAEFRFEPGEAVFSSPVRRQAKLLTGEPVSLLRLYDAGGRRVLSLDRLKPGEMVNIAGLKSGCYLIIAKTGRRTVYTRIVVSR
ncbi:MAG: T9SS type A sorting domain-containing protein [candidate division WOR-3 bacterium]